MSQRCWRARPNRCWTRCASQLSSATLVRHGLRLSSRAGRAAPLQPRHAASLGFCALQGALLAQTFIRHGCSATTPGPRPAAPPPIPAAATLLGATLGDRLRTNAKWALRGMYAQQGGGGDSAGARQLRFVGGLQSRLARWRLALHVGLLRLAFWLSSAVHSATTYLVPVME